MRTTDPISVVESAYRLDLDDAAHLRELTSVMRLALNPDRGIYAYAYDTHQPVTRWLDPAQMSVAGMDPDVLELTFSGFCQPRDNLIELIVRQVGIISAQPPLTRMSDALGGPPRQHPMASELCKRFGFDDLWGVNATDGSSRGIFFNLTRRNLVAPVPAQRQRLTRVAAHVAAALRLRHALVASHAEPEAVLTGGGKVLDARGVAEVKLDLLRRTVLAIDRARAGGERGGDRALDAWTALVAGRWTLVDRFESDGKRFVVAYENQVRAASLQRLTTAEQRIAQLLAHGHHSKLIAYELGVRTGTVTAGASSILRKLRLRRRLDLLTLLRTLNEARVVRHAVGGAQLVIAVCEGDTEALIRLSPREREVVRGALIGGTTDEIAARLGRSPRTVAHQLQSAYRKLGIASRAELASSR